MTYLCWRILVTGHWVSESYYVCVQLRLVPLLRLLGSNRNLHNNDKSMIETPLFISCLYNNNM